MSIQFVWPNSWIWQSYSTSKKNTFSSEESYVFLCDVLRPTFGSPQLSQFLLKKDDSTSQVLSDILTGPNDPLFTQKNIASSQHRDLFFVWTSPPCFSYSPLTTPKNLLVMCGLCSYEEIVAMCKFFLSHATQPIHVCGQNESILGPVQITAIS